MKFRILIAALATALAAPADALAQAPADGRPVVTNAWARATPKGAKVAAAYFQLKGGATPDRLLGAKVDPALAGVAELHDMVEEAGIAKMRRLDVVAVAPGASVDFRPGGRHVMLIDLKAPLEVGQQLRLTLVFEKAGEVAVEARVEPIGSRGGGSGSGSGMGVKGGGPKGSH